ncbi:MAG: hypothetical protein Q8O22_07255 [Candidatus Omnitrophota bacterium]|nr:hypothetical protein [Candidatus Omnitrophota bacterium]
MKKGLLFIVVVLGAMSMVLTQASAQTEGAMQPSTVTTFNSYRLDFFKSQQPVLPQANQPAPMTVEEYYYTDSPVTKGSDGFINATTSWSDIPAEVAETSANENVLTGVTFGFGRGLASSLTRGAAGVVDMVTCVFPPYDEPLAETEYKVEKPNEEGYKVAIFRW